MFTHFAATLLGIVSVNAWHGYNYSYSRLEDRSECPSFEDATRPYKHDFIERLKLWPNLMSQFDIEYGETLYGSAEALELIWKNQNPEDCSTAKYLISGGWPYGFGSRIHMEGAAMGMALHLGRVYLPHPDGDNFFFETNIEFCKNAKRYEPGMNCFYQSYSKCTIKDATAKVGGNVNNLRTYYMGDFRSAFENMDGLQQMKQTLDKMQGINLVQTYGGGPYDLHNYIPHQVRPLIDCSPMRQGTDYYWWRAVSATFITRPNKETLAVLAQYSNLPLQDFSDTITMFVRHGDKGIEMKLLEFPEYSKVAQMMWDRGLVPMSAKYLELTGGTSAGSSTTGATSRRPRLRRLRGSNRSCSRSLRGHAEGETGEAPEPSQQAAGPHAIANATHHNEGRNNNIRYPNATVNLYNAPMGVSIDYATRGGALRQIPYNGTIFLTTEDPVVIEQANKWGAQNHWTVVYTNLFDRASQSAVKTWEEKNRKGTVAVHDKLEYISMLVNMYYSLRSEAYVCTLKSNSCRIIDEMRATVGGKANRYYADLSIETCPHPPCLDMSDVIINWGE